jgi:tRNA(fMet)-specific endonuclease VapC
MKYMLDTNTSIFIIKNKPEFLKKKLQKIKFGNISISNISLSELFHGVYSSSDKTRNLRVLESFLLGVNVLDYDFDASVKYGKIKSQLRKNKLSMSNVDIQIAAHSQSIGSTLITGNITEFKKIKSLKTENWLKKIN